MHTHTHTRTHGYSEPNPSFCVIWRFALLKCTATTKVASFRYRRLLPASVRESVFVCVCDFLVDYLSKSFLRNVGRRRERIWKIFIYAWAANPWVLACLGGGRCVCRTQRFSYGKCIAILGRRKLLPAPRRNASVAMARDLLLCCPKK